MPFSPAFFLVLGAGALELMTRLTPTMDFWSLAWPRFLQGFAMGFTFLPLQALALAAIPNARLANATAAYNVLRNIGGSMGVALMTTLLARRSQQHQVTLTSHVHVWSPEVAERLREWTEHFAAHGADQFTAGRQAMAMLYRETLAQAQILSYADDFWLLLVVYATVLLVIPFMRRVRSEPARARPAEESVARDPGLPAPTE